MGLVKGYRLGKKEILIEAAGPAGRVGVGDSVAVDGVCLSAVEVEKNLLRFSLSRETLERTTLGAFRPGKKVNLELPLTLQTPLGGHLMTGHVDGLGKIIRVIERSPGRRVSVSFPPELKSYFIPKGSVGINGVSLTVAGLGPASFEVELIPITLQNSNLGSLKTGDYVNLECDMIGKYVYNWLVKEKKAG